jgi:hypothetical protein
MKDEVIWAKLRVDGSFDKVQYLTKHQFSLHELFHADRNSVINWHFFTVTFLFEYDKKNYLKRV